MTPDYERSARMAYKTLVALHIDSFPIHPLQILSFCKNTAVHTYDEIAPLFGMYDMAHFKWYVMGNKDAMTIRRDLDNGKTCYELIYDSHAAPSRRRFTLAHELGHIILKHRQEMPCYEREADCFAAHLLAPRPVFEQISAQGVRTDDPESIAEIFGLSISASKVAASDSFRCRDTELTEAVRRLFFPWIEKQAFLHVS